jgi:DNA polymerase I-like protein with 3'-5' exonuclease and polymerase domains
MKRALVLVDAALKEHRLSSRMLLTVHDELLIEVRFPYRYIFRRNAIYSAGMLLHHFCVNCSELQVAPGESDEVEIVTRNMMLAGAGLSVPLTVNMKEGITWAQCTCK